MIGPQCPLVLGSASPRRRELLTALGIALVTRPIDVDETPLPGERVDDYLQRVVRLKMAAQLERGLPALGEGVVLVADTTVCVEGEILGKPTDPAHARQLLSKIVGRSHDVFTRYAICRVQNEQAVRRERCVKTEVTMGSFDDSIIERYAASGEGLDKAGAYAIQGIGSFLVAGIDGSHSNVIGLPVSEVVSDLLRLGVLSDFP